MVTGSQEAGQAVDADIRLTQLGHVELKRTLSWAKINCSFRIVPSATDEGYMSLLGGELSVGETVPKIARRDSAGSADCVRYTSAGVLAAAGFRVEWLPEPLLPEHVAVYADREWDGEVSIAFAECFTEFVKG